jgi:cell division protein FtsL
MKIDQVFTLSTVVLFIFCLFFLALSLSVVFLQRDVKNLNTEIKELRLLFNQKFLQEMVVDKPTIRFEF